MANLYGVFFNEIGETATTARAHAQWSLGRNKRRALVFAKKHNGYVVVVRHADSYGAPSAWDAPTFKISGELIADYRA